MRSDATVALIAVLIVWAQVQDPTRSFETNAAQAPLTTPATRDDGFRVRETEHFTIAYDVPYEVLSPLEGRLENTYDAVRRFCEDMGLTPEPTHEPLRVLLFDRHEAFTAYLGTLGISTHGLAGVYHQDNRVAAFCNVQNSPDLEQITQQVAQLRRQLLRAAADPARPLLSKTEREELRSRLDALETRRDALVQRFNRFVLQHEATHQVMYHMGVHVVGADNPAWVVEGLACQFEVPQTGAHHPMTRVNHLRLADFRDALGAAPDAVGHPDGAYDIAVARGHFLPIADLVGEDDPFAVGEPHLAYRYAQAWALVHYLHRARHDAFAGYVRELSGRRIGEPLGRERELDAFRNAFGEPNQALVHDWLAWVFRLRLDRHEAGR